MLERVCELLKIRPPTGEVTGYLIASGPTVPTDADAGYQPGCIFIHTDGTAGSALYCNEGTVLSCDFDLVTIA